MARKRTRTILKKFQSEKAKDIVGNTYLELTVIKYLFTQIVTVNGKKDRWYETYYLCKCNCGKEKVCEGSRLRNNRIRTCGCKKNIKPKGKDAVNWKGYEEISGNLWSGYIRHARERDIEFKLKIEDIWSLYLKQNKKCAISGIDIKFGKTQLEETTASLDRIDSSKEYTIDNIQWVYKDINKMKNTFDQKYFINICKKIAKYNENIDSV